ncbi:hypothetical protein [Flavobacterium cerinum]|uniref:Holin n=1 Tax=Flavobacterium cerinum TaxID=2502784 RepID=A0A444HBP2_9FLAO|nr:hypothetical protein [Flavobacterium cerinum]RWX00901.1 hypothetical protein EPI11_07725 [Flavobacterium cerinum]
MGKFRNWILAAVLVILGTLDLTTDLIPVLLKQVNAPEWVGTALRVVALFCTVVKMKLTPASLKEAESKAQA